MSDQGFVYSQNEQRAVKSKTLAIEITLLGSTTLAACLGATNSPDGVQVYTQASSATAPSDANFASLVSNATPTVVGIYVLSGIAKKVNRCAVDANTIFSGSMTAGVVTLKGAAASLGSNRTGITTDKNIALQVSCTTLKQNADNTNHKFTVELDYDVE